MKACYDLKGCADDKLMEVNGACLNMRNRQEYLYKDEAILEIPHAKHWGEFDLDALMHQAASLSPKDATLIFVDCLKSD